MTFRLKIAAWVVASCLLLIAVMMLAAHHHLEEELRRGRWDRTHPKHPEWVIHNSYAEEEIRDILSELMQLWLWIAGPLVGLSLGAGFMLAKRALRPIEDINLQLGAMHPQSLHGGIRIPEADAAIEKLANHLNALLEQAGAAYRGMAEFSSKVAHELRTPLMLLRMRIEKAPPGTCPDFQEALQHELARLSRYVERALLAARAESQDLKPQQQLIELDVVFNEFSDDYRLLAEERGMELNCRIADRLHVLGDADLLRQLLHSLMENAVRYGACRIELEARRTPTEVELRIANDYRHETRATPGTGLGLRLARGISEACGIGLTVEDCGDAYAVRLQFPTAPLGSDATGT